MPARGSLPLCPVAWHPDLGLRGDVGLGVGQVDTSCPMIGLVHLGSQHFVRLKEPWAGGKGAA